MNPASEQKARDFFLSQKVPPLDLVSYEKKGKLATGFYTRSLAKAAAFKEAFRGLRGAGFQFKLRFLGRRDWLDKWNAYFHIKPFGRKFVIVPLWKKKSHKPGRRIPLYLDPLGAFGTGCHETTRLTEEFMETLEGKFYDFFDIGTGTGILSIAASYLGARDIVAIDIHGPSVLSARFNIRQNQRRHITALKADLREFKIKRSFDLVAANLLSKVLTENRSRIVRRVKKKKYLLVSGIGLENLRAFRRDFEKGGLKCRRVLKGKKWAALLYQRL